MAWQRIEWSCGHNEYQQLYGPEKERDRYAEWAAEKGLCPDCYKEKKRAEEKEAGPHFLLRRLPLPDKEQQMEAVCYSGSYGIKDRLKERGWRFGREVVPAVSRGGRIDIGKPGRPGWTKSSEDPAVIEEELRWIADNGWPVHKESELTTLLSAPHISTVHDLPAHRGAEE